MSADLATSLLAPQCTTVATEPAVAEFDDALARAFGKVERAAADGVDKQIKKDGKDRRYVTLASVDRACRIALTDEGFSYPQLASTRVTGDGGLVLTITTQLRRKGCAIVTSLELPVLGQMRKGGEGFAPPTAQSVGSAMTYGRRYALTALLGVCPDDDDDGHAASKAPASDPVWDAYVVQRDAVAARFGEDGPAAYQRILRAANMREGEHDDHELRELTAAAIGILRAPQEPKVPGAGAARERASAKGEQEIPPAQEGKAPPVLTPAMEAYTAAAKQYLEIKIADFRDAEGRDMPRETEKGIRERIKTIAAAACGLKAWPGAKATEQQLAKGTAAIRQACEPPSPFALWTMAQDRYVDQRAKDYKQAEGQDPPHDVLHGYLATTLAIGAKAIGVPKWPGARATPEQCRAGIAALQGAA